MCDLISKHPLISGHPHFVAGGDYCDALFDRYLMLINQMAPQVVFLASSVSNPIYQYRLCMQISEQYITFFHTSTGSLVNRESMMAIFSFSEHVPEMCCCVFMQMTQSEEHGGIGQGITG